MLDTKRQRKYAASQPVLCKAFYIKIAPALYLHFIFYIHDDEADSRPPESVSESVQRWMHIVIYP